MASKGKKKTTMAKLNREVKLRERRLEKAARKDARKLAAQQPSVADETTIGEDEWATEGHEDESGVPAAPAR